MAAPNEPRGRHRKFSDQQLREDLEAGLTPVQIAAKYGCTRQAVDGRMKQRDKMVAAAAVAPQEARRYTGAVLDQAEEIIGECVKRARLLQDACDRYLQDAADPSRYDVGPRSSEIIVTHWKLNEDGEKIGRRPEKETLSALLARVEQFGDFEVVSAESKHADPRTLVLSTMAQCESLIRTALEIIEKIYGAKMMEAFREEILSAIGSASPETRDAIEANLRSTLLRWTAATGSGILPSG